MKLGLIVFCNNGGIGIQTRRLCYMLKPDKLLAIDSSNFSKITEQHFEWYDGFSGYRVNGFPKDHEVKKFLTGLTHVVCVENPLNYNLTDYAKRMGIKVFIQTNYEFCDFLNNKSLALPYKFLMPSYWKVEEMKKMFGEDSVDYLPPPTDPNEFKEAREINFKRKGYPRLLHVVGTLAVHDRNGTLDLLKALKYSKEDYELVIHSQQELPLEYMINDPRLKYSMRSLENSCDLYKDFDALILPRRYAGLCLPCNEALMSGLPVIMTDTSPNNELLPKEWLVKSYKTNEFKARTMIDIYSSDIKALGEKIDWIVKQNVDTIKIQAFELGYNNFSNTILEPKYRELFK
jgi:glycosyltransferase involved in cell wall biosynthesis